MISSYTTIMYKKEKAEIWFLTPQIITYSRRMGGTPLFGGSWGPILQLDLENWTVFLEVLYLTYHILDFVQGLFFAGVLLKESKGIFSREIIIYPHTDSFV